MIQVENQKMTKIYHINVKKKQTSGYDIKKAEYKPKILNIINIDSLLCKRIK